MLHVGSYSNFLIFNIDVSHQDQVQLPLKDWKGRSWVLHRRMQEKPLFFHNNNEDEKTRPIRRSNPTQSKNFELGRVELTLA